MAMNEAIAAASRIYVDANCIIYFVERKDGLQTKIATLFSHAAETGKSLACSEIGIAECLHGAFKLRSGDLEAVYREIFHDIALFELCPLDGQRAMAAAKLGAEKSFRLVDALHFLAAIELGCEVLVTNDARIHSSHGLNVVHLRDL